MTAHTETFVQTPHAQRRTDVPTRMVLLAVLVALALATVLTGRLESTLADLESDVAAGRVTAIELQVTHPSLPADHGYVIVTWKDGVVPRYLEVDQVTSLDPPSGYDDDQTRVRGPIAEHLDALAPGELNVTIGEAPGAWGTAMGWRMPFWIGIGVLLWTFALLGHLVGGPQPRHATKWAWFWLFTSAVGPVAVVVYLVSGLKREPAPHERRLTGGWAFLLSILIPRPWW